MKKCALLMHMGVMTCAVILWLVIGAETAVPLQQNPPSNTPSWYYESDQAAASLGFSVSGLGDVNGDGFGDVLVGAPKYSGETYKSGTLFVFYGSPGGLQDLPSRTFNGDQTGADFGFAVASAGDVNGDGFADVIVSAPRYTHEQSREGRVYGFYGSSNGLPLSPSWQIESDMTEAYLGWSVASAGDVNHDGFDDVIIGAKWAKETFTNEGMAQLYLGSEAGLATTPVWTIYGGQAGASLGTAVSPAGDVNQDGFADVLVGAPLYNTTEEAAGKVLLFCGGTNGPSQEPCWQASGNQPNARLGTAVSGGGDIDGDGYDDVIVSAPYQNALSPEVGIVYLYRGSATDFLINASWTAVADQSLAQFGTAIKMDADINEDGYHDVLIGAYTYSADQSQEGKIFVYYGGPTGPTTQPTWVAEGNKAEAEFGFTLSSGDVDGDSQSELLVGAPNYRKETELRGRVFLFEPLPADPAGTLPHSLFLPLITN